MGNGFKNNDFTADGTITGTTLLGSVDTNVAAAGVTLSGTTLAADGTDANIDITITPKGTGGLIPSDDRGTNLGTTAVSWDNLYVDGVSFDDGSNTLDDYEEGSWTPTLLAQNVPFSSISYTINTGSYVKIGRMVKASCRVEVSALTMGSASGELQIRDFPFSASTSQEADIGSVEVGNINLDDATVNLNSRMLKGYNVAYIISSRDNASRTTVLGTNISSSTNIYMTICYETDS